MKILQQIKNRLMYPAAYAYISFQSEVNKIKSLTKKDKVVFEQSYDGRKILLMALFEKGELRDDIRHLLQCAKQQGAYVLCINTLKINAPEKHSDFIDCYIEKYNFGRDFGSYQSAFSYIYKNGLAESCPRLLMLNDSIFYDKAKCDRFIGDMFSSPCEALGGTENFENEHHLGSFCIAFAGSVIRAQRFRDYWKAYKCSDVRPLVIKRGEMALSNVLKKCVSSPDNFRALYDITRTAMHLKEHPEVLDQLSTLSRADENPEFKSFSFSAVTAKIASKYLHNSTHLIGLESITAEIDDVSSLGVFYAYSLPEYFDFIEKSISVRGNVSGTLMSSIREEVTFLFLDFFIKGSQIHQNGIFLHKIGLPIIKLDGLYRGAFCVRDVEVIANELGRDDAESFRRIMYSRPYGRNTLFGWKRAAFERGLI